jgi:gamma-glutamyl:cysteine ligase YbdK (ATP-grasp superfamily)
MDQTFLGLFEAFGVELEYMVVDAASLNVRPIVDRLLQAQAGRLVSEVDCGMISWSNELALHVLEFKTTDPAPELRPLAAAFQGQVDRANELLAAHGARLMPSGMHPWMDPDQQLQLWPHDYNPVYEAFHRIFDCRGHGWANLQSVHLNLPFADGEQFGRLHAAIRLVIPLLPALAASSPVVNGRVTGLLDNRLDFYRSNTGRIPSITAGVVPEPVFDPGAYQRTILQPMYDDIAPHDPDGKLKYEWLNARGAIARFDRQTIEVRVMDVQECPAMDLAVVALVTSLISSLVEQRWSDGSTQRQAEQSFLERLFLVSLTEGLATPIDDAHYLDLFGASLNPGATIGQLWSWLLGELPSVDAADRQRIELILSQGNLADRIRRQLAAGRTLNAVYGQLCDCLAHGLPFQAGPVI